MPTKHMEFHESEVALMQRALRDMLFEKLERLSWARGKENAVDLRQDIEQLKSLLTRISD